MNNFQKNRFCNQRGLASVEFTLIAALFLFVIFAIIGIARTMYVYNATVNATRLGARLAVVCSPSAANNIKAQMVARVPDLTAANVNLTYNPSGCSVATCVSVTASVSNFIVSIATPASFPLGNITIPGFSTTLVRESMDSTNNSVCS